MRTSQLAFTFILTVLLVGSLSAQPMADVGDLIPTVELQGSTGEESALLTDDICTVPIDMTGSSTAYRYVTAGTCIEIIPTTCPECSGCDCSLTIDGPGKNNEIHLWWCDNGTPKTGYSLCIYFDQGGDFTFTLDVCPGETGSIECGTCCGR